MTTLLAISIQTSINAQHVIIITMTCVRMHSRLMHLVAMVCVRIGIYIYIYIQNFDRKQAVQCLKLPLTNILLRVICCLLFEFKCLQCGLLCPASYTDRAIRAFPNITRRPLAPKCFLLSFNGTPHPLGQQLASLVVTLCASTVCVLVLVLKKLQC